MGTTKTLRFEWGNVASITTGEVMNVIRKSDELLDLLHQAGWSIGDAAFAGAEGVSWLVYGTQGGYELRAEDASRDEAWKQACRQAEALGWIEPL
jgi:hypothetical protein